MKKLDMSSYGVEELDANEMKNLDGGFNLSLITAISAITSLSALTPPLGAVIVVGLVIGIGIMGIGLFTVRMVQPR